MGSHGSERRRRRSGGLKRDPLSDLTNAPSIPPSSALSLVDRRKSKNSVPRSFASPDPDEGSIRCASSIGSSGHGGRVAASPLDAPRALDQSSNASVANALNSETSEHTIVYTRQRVERRKDKRKNVAAPTKRIRNIRSIAAEDEDGCEPTLSQGFIEMQRAYFAEIDAFQLAEEVASESELE